MNDFTKDQLIYILKCIDPQHRNHFETLCIKIKEIIDNYCDHNWLTFLEDNYSDPFIDKCLECNALRFSNDNK